MPDLLVALAIFLGIKNPVLLRLIELLRFRQGLLLILMVLFKTGSTALLLLELSCAG